MHPGFEKDYRYLLSSLIPRQLLSSSRLEGVQHALTRGNRVEMVREAYQAMEELSVKGVFKRDGLRRSLNRVTVSYARADRPATITLMMTGEEWEEISGEAKRVEVILPSVLANIISSLSLNDSPQTIVNKISDIINLIGNIYYGASGNLLLLQGVPSPEVRENGKIMFSSWHEISTNRFYRHCLTSGISHSFLRLNGAYTGKSFFPIEQDTRSVLLVPLVTQREKWGVLEIHLRRENPPDKDTFQNFFLITQGIIRLLENNRHFEKMVSIDRLTQVHNRNYYESQLPLEMERAIRNRKSLTFLIMDIDDFKEVNDRYGHDVGDAILKLVAQAVKSHLRKIDLLFRYGGEEFIALLPGAGREDAERTAERIREVIAESEHTMEDGKEIKVTISIGGCVFPTDAQSEIDLLRRADNALYLSKREGKNRVTFYEFEPS